MFGNTLTLSVAAANDTVAIRINGGNEYSSEYLCKAALHEVRIKIRHSKTKATADRPSYDRHNFEVVKTVWATATVPQYIKKMYFVFELLPSDDDLTLIDAIADWMIASTGGNLTSLRNWES